MHARVISVQLRPGTADEASRIYRESVLPAARRQPGFQRALFLVDPITERAVSVTQWATEADLAASETSVAAAPECIVRAPGPDHEATVDRSE